MRPLPVAPLGEVPAFVRGIAVVRGAPAIVVDAARLLGVSGAQATRFVILRAGDNRRFALAVDSVLDVRPFAGDELAALPALVRADAIAQIGAAEAGLVIVLEAARAIPDEIWAAVEARP